MSFNVIQTLKLITQKLFSLVDIMDPYQKGQLLSKYNLWYLHENQGVWLVGDWSSPEEGGATVLININLTPAGLGGHHGASNVYTLHLNWHQTIINTNISINIWRYSDSDQSIDHLRKGAEKLTHLTSYHQLTVSGTIAPTDPMVLYRRTSRHVTIPGLRNNSTDERTAW